MAQLVSALHFVAVTRRLMQRRLTSSSSAPVSWQYRRLLLPTNRFGFSTTLITLKKRSHPPVGGFLFGIFRRSSGEDLGFQLSCPFLPFVF